MAPAAEHHSQHARITKQSFSGQQRLSGKNQSYTSRDVGLDVDIQEAGVLHHCNEKGITGFTKLTVSIEA